MSRNHPLDRIGFFEAVESGNAARVVQLINEGVSVNTVRAENRTALHIASCNEHFEVARELMSLGADPNMQNINGVSPLHDACWRGHVDFVRLMLQHGANPNLTDVSGKTALQDAALMNHKEIVELLLDYGADPTIMTTNGNSPLHTAILNRLVEVAELLLEKGADPNIRRSGDKKTPLHILCGRDNWVEHQPVDAKLLQLLLDHDADTSVADGEGQPPLFVACQRCNLNAIFLLLQHWVGRSMYDV